MVLPLSLQKLIRRYSYLEIGLLGKLSPGSTMNDSLSQGLKSSLPWVTLSSMHVLPAFLRRKQHDGGGHSMTLDNLG
ncbi:hypothetical protein Bca4012_056557 [Brassica carinata]|uniref:Uncharacterized protein n=1 Tax=Brassica carinata TaxID=52824 RepID=A0A8X8B1J1_BRACI|nr:hypothetical protein Bca52824_013622 [Brassica carinata]